MDSQRPVGIESHEIQAQEALQRSRARREAKPLPTPAGGESLVDDRTI